MASLAKFTHGAVRNQLRHYNREIQKDSNRDIDPNRAHLNLKFRLHEGMSDWEYYKKRKSTLYCYGRADVKTLASWVITAPKELKTREEEIAFFKSAYRFLRNRYGKENAVSAVIHYDEGKIEKLKDRWGNYVRDENGEVMQKLVLGRPHLHFSFIPVVQDLNSKHIQAEKICANDLLNKRELQHFHTDLQNHLKKDGIEAKVLTGKTKAQGRNYTVKEMKEQYELHKELERLRELERKYTQEHQHTLEKGGRW